jgi:plasmid maintenance system killer protein
MAGASDTAINRHKELRHIKVRKALLNNRKEGQHLRRIHSIVMNEQWRHAFLIL